MGTTFSSRPSTILHVQDEWAAYQLDALTAVIGRNVEAALSQGKTLDEALAASATPGQWSDFKEPPAAAIGRVAIPESGVW